MSIHRIDDTDPALRQLLDCDCPTGRAAATIRELGRALLHNSHATHHPDHAHGVETALTLALAAATDAHQTPTNAHRSDCRPDPYPSYPNPKQGRQKGAQPRRPHYIATMTTHHNPKKPNDR